MMRSKGSEVEPEVTLTTEQAVELIQCSERTLLNLRQRHGLPHIKLGAKVVFIKSSIIEWLHGREVRKTLN